MDWVRWSIHASAIERPDLAIPHRGPVSRRQSAIEDWSLNQSLHSILDFFLAPTPHII